MPVLSQLVSGNDPFADDTEDTAPPEYGLPTDEERRRRPKLTVSDEAGRRTISKVQEKIEGPSVGGFFANLGSDAGEFAKGVASLAAMPFLHPQETARVLSHPIATAEKVGEAIGGAYKEAYTPHADESVPGMLLRRLYEKPFSTLMDASAVGQVAFGGAGLAARAATAGSFRAAGEAAAKGLVEAGGGLASDVAPEVGTNLAQKAASAQRAIEVFDDLSRRAKLLDPITIAKNTGTAAFKTFAPDLAEKFAVTKQMTDATAERAATLRALEDQKTQAVSAAFKDLNPAERAVIHPYISGRVNFDRPVGEQLLMATGEWAPVKGDVVRPDALEAARQQYIPIQQEYARRQGLMPDQVGAVAGENAMNFARQHLKENFDPLDPTVQDFVTSYSVSAVRRNAEALKARATLEARTALDIAKEKSWRSELEGMMASNLHATLEDAGKALPKPVDTTPDEALRLMGPQGGTYWPHSSEVYTRDQSTIANHLTKLGEASTYKENTAALFRAGVTEHQDPVKQLVRAYMTFEHGNTWLDHAVDAAENGVAAGTVKRLEKGASAATHPDVLAGTHQPFIPSRHIAEDMAEEDAQRIYTRLLEVADDPTVKGIKLHDVLQGVSDNAGHGPIGKLRTDLPTYIVPKGMGHAFASAREAMQPSTNPIVRLMDPVTQWWNWTNLNLKLTRMVNNVIGNTAFAVMQGVHPFTPRGLQSLIATGRALGYKAGLTQSEEAGRLARVFDLPGVRGQGLLALEKEATGSVGEKVLGFGAGAGPLGRAATAPIRAIGKWGNLLSSTNSNIESAYRAASMFYELSPRATERAQKMFGNAVDSMSLGERVDAMARAGAEVTMKLPEYRDALKNVNRFFYNYDRATPFERTTIRRIFPYHKFFQHSTDLLTRFPFEHPLKGTIARTMGKAATQDIKDQVKQWGLDWERDVPPQFQSSIPIRMVPGPDGKPSIQMLNTKGPDPFSQLQGPLAEQALQMLNPIVKIAIERTTGVNLFTRERYRGAASSYTGREVDPKTGQIVDTFNHPSAGESLLRSFWPYQLVREMASNGRVPTDTASLLMMATSDPNSWQYDKHGQVVQRPGWSPGQSLTRLAGYSTGTVTAPTKEEKSSRRGSVNSQLRDLLQRHPEKRGEIMAALAQSRGEIDRERQ